MIRVPFVRVEVRALCIEEHGAYGDTVVKRERGEGSVAERTAMGGGVEASQRHESSVVCEAETEHVVNGVVFVHRTQTRKVALKMTNVGHL